jgi:hypothetical protein
LDGLRSSHPIDVDVQSPSQISEIFDAVRYGFNFTLRIIAKISFGLVTPRELPLFAC